MPRRTATLLTSTLLLIATLCAGLLISVPYGEMSPGPTVNTLGEHDGEPVLSISGEKTYDTSGHLNMTTVRVTSVTYEMNLLEAVYGWLADDSAVVPFETLYPGDLSPDEVEEQNAEEFSRSQESAKVAALRELGYDIPTLPIVASVVAEAPADGKLHAGDAIVAVDGTEISSPEQVAEQVTEHEPGEDVVFTIVPAEQAEEALDAGGELPDETEDVTITTTSAPDDGRAIVGIEAGAAHAFPFEIDIQLADVGGPSAGLMFALGLIDVLDPEDLTGGEFVAGTGTIDEEGVVGPIGGVSMKTIAAREAGADFFLTPEENCATAASTAPDGLTLVEVGSLQDALAALEHIREGTTDELPLCQAG
ncbi:PDZ domain-containing protein [Streptomyces sp. 7-21]|jgi:PDZ domain-containing protein|uniref:YlbL family protein n=1 Tax=Streptomyces sp. 7-21 TaxID=2802283 RepID=UPI00191D0A97|nr:PDZ domain-containing protein [Streptomyces sp. 7-21]MBL1066338.1 PDZ domain-containing protein [Streptomyces sp. 7-21]